MDSVVCSDCGKMLTETTSTTDIKPCPDCGSLLRTLYVEIREAVTIREKIGMKHKRPGHKKPLYESVSGDDLHRATGQWNHLTREIDRENNLYKEVIINPGTGEVIRECNEPLTAHIERGSAKPKP